MLPDCVAACISSSHSGCSFYFLAQRRLHMAALLSNHLSDQQASPTTGRGGYSGGGGGGPGYAGYREQGRGGRGGDAQARCALVQSCEDLL
jgi:hypothetical protein